MPEVPRSSILALSCDWPESDHVRGDKVGARRLSAFSGDKWRMSCMNLKVCAAVGCLRLFNDLRPIGFTFLVLTPHPTPLQFLVCVHGFSCEVSKLEP